MNCPNCSEYTPVNYEKCPNCGCVTAESDKKNETVESEDDEKDIDLLAGDPENDTNDHNSVIEAEVVVEPPPASLPGEPTKTCPYCAETIRFEAIICRYCMMNLKTGRPVAGDVKTWDVVFNLVKYGCAVIVGLPLLTILILLILTRGC